MIRIATFTYEECDYLEKLKTRNKSNGFANQWQPLKEPLGPRENRLRKSIGEKCDRYIQQLAIAELSGVLPSQKMTASELNCVMEAIDKVKWVMILDMFEKI